MKRIKKLVLLQVRSLSLRCNHMKLYYWTEIKLFKLRSITILPEFYYRFLFGMSMRLVRVNHFQTFANKAIHTIPLHIRFNIT